MSKEIAIPEHLKRFISAPGASTEADAMASASISIPRISLKGRRFRLIEGGEEIRRPADEIFVVILAVEPGAGLMQKTFYKNGYQSGDSSPPDCASSNGVTPDAWIQNPVNDLCKTCPNNVFGSAISTNGKKTKACKDSKRLWVAEPDNLNGTVYALGVPVTSLKAMAEYGALLKQNNIPTASVITKISMKDSEFPELLFDFVGVLEEDVLEVAMDRNERKDWNMGSSAGPMMEYQPDASRTPMQAPGARQLLENQGTTNEVAEPAVKTSKASDGQMSADEAAGGW